MYSLFYLIKTKTLIGPLLIAGLGMISSIWCNCIFIITLRRNNGYYNNASMEYSLIYDTIQYEYIVICLITITTLVWGLVKSYKRYLLPWACLKVCESIVIFVGSFKILSKDFDDFSGILPLAIAAIFINIYASLCVYKAYKRMINKLPLKNLINNSNEQVKHEEKENIKIEIETQKPLFETNENILTDEKSEKV